MWRHFVGATAVVLLIIIGLIAAAIVLLVALQLAYHLLSHRKARRVRRELMAKGRFREWSRIVETFSQGQGMLIVQYVTPGGWLHDGPIIEWWTEDDLIGRAPVVLPLGADCLPADHRLKQLGEYAGEIVSEYTNVDSGSAVLTCGPGRAGWWFEREPFLTMRRRPDGLKITGRKLSETYPKGKIITLLSIWRKSHEKLDWVVFLGDADAVLSRGVPPSLPSSLS